MYRVFAGGLFLSLAFILAGTARAQSPAQLRPQFVPSLPPTFTPPRPIVNPSSGPAVYPYFVPPTGQAGLVTRRGQAFEAQAGPGFIRFQFSTPTNIGKPK
jgi:hypothetical protein